MQDYLQHIHINLHEITSLFHLPPFDYPYQLQRQKGNSLTHQVTKNLVFFVYDFTLKKKQFRSASKFGNQSIHTYF